jgi:hypothetical protein
MRKNVLSILVMICLVFTMLPINAFAADYYEFDAAFETEDGHTVSYLILKHAIKRPKQ